MVSSPPPYFESSIDSLTELLDRSHLALANFRSDNIRVVSIMGRFLEHSRVMRFENRGDPRFYLSSANCTTRDLTRRVELALRVDDRKCKQELQVTFGTLSWDF
jgi:polyphosphate kinase